MFNRLNFNEVPYIVATISGLKVSEFIDMVKVFLENCGFWLLGLFGGVGKGWGTTSLFFPWPNW